MSLIAVNIHYQGYDVYCGRAGKGVAGSPLQNPHKGEGAIENFRLDLWESIKSREHRICLALLLILVLEKQKGQVRLGCFCKPKPCHVDVIISALESPHVLKILYRFLERLN